MTSHFAYNRLMRIHPLLTVGKLPLKTLVAKQLPTKTHARIYTHTRMHTHTLVLSKISLGMSVSQNKGSGPLCIHMHILVSTFWFHLHNSWLQVQKMKIGIYFLSVALLKEVLVSLVPRLPCGRGKSMVTTVYSCANRYQQNMVSQFSVGDGV